MGALPRKRNEQAWKGSLTYTVKSRLGHSFKERHRGEEEGMKFELYTDVALTCDLSAYRLRRGNIVKLVDHHNASDGTEGYSIEVFNALGYTITVTAVPVATLEALREDEVLCARPYNESSFSVIYQT